MISLAVVAALGWTPTPTLPWSRGRATARIVMMKASPDDTPEVRPEININKNSIVEFHDPKHGNGAAPPVLGIVQGAEYKAKGGARILILDADGTTHQVKEAAVHINMGVY